MSFERVCIPNIKWSTVSLKLYGSKGMTKVSLNLFISSLQWYINLQANKQKYEKELGKKALSLYKFLSLIISAQLNTCLKNQPSICDKIIMWNWQRKQEKKRRGREETRIEPVGKPYREVCLQTLLWPWKVHRPSSWSLLLSELALKLKVFFFFFSLNGFLGCIEHTFNKWTKKKKVGYFWDLIQGPLNLASDALPTELRGLSLQGNS